MINKKNMTMKRKRRLKFGERRSKCGGKGGRGKKKKTGKMRRNGKKKWMTPKRGTRKMKENLFFSYFSSLDRYSCSLFFSCGIFLLQFRLDEKLGSQRPT